MCRSGKAHLPPSLTVVPHTCPIFQQRVSPSVALPVGFVDFVLVFVNGLRLTHGDHKIFVGCLCSGRCTNRVFHGYYTSFSKQAAPSNMHSLKADLEAVAFQVYLYTCIFYLTNMRMGFVRRYTRFSIFDLGPGPGPSPTASKSAFKHAAIK